ncbi:unnamed protein product [Caenorhabditis sp. 36 PRJEB53466]|nr:unnamed protein product [Caenorhabditis sp. 36 PRJEB53466]
MVTYSQVEQTTQQLKHQHLPRHAAVSFRHRSGIVRNVLLRPIAVKARWYTFYYEKVDRYVDVVYYFLVKYRVTVPSEDILFFMEGFPNELYPLSVLRVTPPIVPRRLEFCCL